MCIINNDNVIYLYCKGGKAMKRSSTLAKLETILLSLIIVLYIIIIVLIAVNMILPNIKSYSIYEISGVRRETPSRIVVHFDDPSVEPKSVDDAETVSKIMSYYEVRVYKKNTSSAPMPKSNAHLTFVYADGVAVSVPVGDFTRYKVETVDDLGSFIESLR